MKKNLLLLLGLSCIVFTTGCVTGRRSVNLPVNKVPPVAVTKGAVQVGKVTDARVFENKPRAPSTPSIDGDALKLTEQERGVFIGRQRNGYGKAMGDVALPAGDSVMERTRALIEEGFSRRGFTVAREAAPGSLQLDVVVDEFWGWFTPGAFAVSFEARVGAGITVRRGADVRTLKVKGYGMNRGQVASDANWQLAYSRAFEDFLTNLQSEIDKAAL